MRRWIAGSSLRGANYKISPPGPIALPALSGFSTPVRDQYLSNLRRNDRGGLSLLPPPLRGRAGERGKPRGSVVVAFPPPQPSPPKGGGNRPVQGEGTVYPRCHHGQLTCRGGAPKTRHQFNGVNGPDAAF